METTGRKKFVRIVEGKKIAGVCTGLAEYFNIDVVLIRAIFILLALSWGGGILLYLILWIVAPVEVR